jgi:5-oxoprolinase (ATP-hydrolysing)
MGGTSTDVSRVEERVFSTKYSFAIEGIELCTPHLEIDTIAAGGGSKLTFKNGMFVVGPESVGSDPGPACYGIGNELALTDANLILGRLDETYFPKIFGKNKDEGLNLQASKQAF